MKFFSKLLINVALLTAATSITPRWYSGPFAPSPIVYSHRPVVVSHPIYDPYYYYGYAPYRPYSIFDAVANGISSIGYAIGADDYRRHYDHDHYRR